MNARALVALAVVAAVAATTATTTNRFPDELARSEFCCQTCPSWEICGRSKMHKSWASCTFFTRRKIDYTRIASRLSGTEGDDVELRLTPMDKHGHYFLHVSWGFPRSRNPNDISQFVLTMTLETTDEQARTGQMYLFNLNGRRNFPRNISKESMKRHRFVFDCERLTGMATYRISLRALGQDGWMDSYEDMTTGALPATGNTSECSWAWMSLMFGSTADDGYTICFTTAPPGHNISSYRLDLLDKFNFGYGIRNWSVEYKAGSDKSKRQEMYICREFKMNSGRYVAMLHPEPCLCNGVKDDCTVSYLDIHYQSTKPESFLPIKPEKRNKEYGVVLFAFILVLSSLILIIYHFLLKRHKASVHPSDSA